MPLARMAQLSATTIFLKNPHNACRRPSTACAVSNVRGLRNCGSRFVARSMGPATSCGKKEMKAKKATMSRVGASFSR